ncbi:MAG: c-type heme family protein [Planctomycetaceae bacterium]
MKFLFVTHAMALCIATFALRSFAEDPVSDLPAVVVPGGETGDGAAASEDTHIPPPTTVAEARARARLLHETIHGTLQVVHRDFFNEEDAHAIPSASLEDVFEELSKSYRVKVRWLIVDTDMVNVDHKAQDAFEENAVKSLAKGEQQLEAVEGETYRYAAPIRLASQCLKCHVKDRTSTDERTAGLLISMPLLGGAAGEARAVDGRK